MRGPSSQHSDRRVQYLSIPPTERLAEEGLAPAVGRIGDSFDNAPAESFFATLECEFLDRRRFHTPHEARGAVFEFTPSRCSCGIEGWYNPQRRHSSLGYASPLRYEMAHAYRG